MSAVPKFEFFRALVRRWPGALSAFVGCISADADDIVNLRFWHATEIAAEGDPLRDALFAFLTLPASRGGFGLPGDVASVGLAECFDEAARGGSA
jgi:hypothetical protein